MPADLTDPQQLKAAMERLGISPVRSAGQHFLRSRAVLEATIAALDPDTAAVTELGAGPGALTLSLLEAGFRVRALERDAALAGLLASLVPPERQEELTLVPADLRKAPWEWPGQRWQLAGNIPYNLSGYIIRRMVQQDPARAVLLVQKEVALRMAAGRSQLSLLGLAVQLWGRAAVVRRVPRGSFWPAPAVDSALVQIIPHENRLGVEARERVLAYARPLFAGRRKQIGGSVRRSYGLDKAAAQAAFTAAGIERAQRPQEVGVEAWVRLAEELERRGISPN